VGVGVSNWKTHDYDSTTGYRLLDCYTTGYRLLDCYTTGYRLHDCYPMGYRLLNVGS